MFFFRKCLEQEFSPQRDNSSHVKSFECQHRLRADALHRSRISQRSSDESSIHGSVDEDPSARHGVRHVGRKCSCRPLRSGEQKDQNTVIQFCSENNVQIEKQITLLVAVVEIYISLVW